ncbi:MAG TPA: diguanylate cyclase [Gemmatimonadales bacterium]|nr:diguanylate cyclase [Gemmatimonadales bacterium]
MLHSRRNPPLSDWTEIIARPFRSLHLDTIRSKILVFAVVTALLPMLITTVISYRQARDLLADKIDQELRTASDETARELAQWLDGRLADLRTATGSYVIADNLGRTQGNGGGQALVRVRDYLASVRERAPDYEALFVVDARGRVVTSSGRLSGVPLPQERFNGLHTGDAVVGDPYWDGGLGKAVMVLAVPIRQPDGRFVGALAAKMNLRAAADLLERFSPGDAGEVYLMTDQGKLVMSSRGSSAELMRTKLPKTMAQALVDKEGSTVVYRRGDGREVLGALRRVPQLRWAAVTEMPRADAFRPLARLRTDTVATLVVLFAAIGLIAVVLGLMIVRPLERLAGAAAKVAAGDLSVDLPAGGTGEVGYLARAFSHLVMRAREREGQGELERLSVTDALTGLYNRRHLMGTLANEVQRSRRLRRTFSVLMADVDHFKQYNDTHGHLAGDAALVKIAEILRKTTRGVDSVARYGGEEFVVMLIEASIATAASVAERVRARVATEEFGGGKVSVSIGVAEYPSHGDTPEELIESADGAMYRAKGEGRDRVMHAGATRSEQEKPTKRRRKGEA